MTTLPPAAPDEFEVRRAERADLLAVFRIEQAAFPQPWPFGAFEQYLGREGFMVAVADAVVGYVVSDTVPNHGRPIGHVKDLAVAADYRREGLGSRLLRRSLGILEAEGVPLVKLEVRQGNRAARRLYRAFEFEHRRTIPRYYSDGEHALVLVKEL